MDKRTEPLDHIAIGMAVKTFRERSKVGTSDLAKRVGLGQSSITRIELGQRSLAFHEAVAIAAEMQISLGDLASTAWTLQQKGHVLSQVAARKKMEEAQAELNRSLREAHAAIEASFGVSLTGP